MARGRGSSSVGWAIAVVILSILFVASVVAAIYLASERTKMIADREKAEANLRKLVLGEGELADASVTNRIKDHADYQSASDEQAKRIPSEIKSKGVTAGLIEENRLLRIILGGDTLAGANFLAVKDRLKANPVPVTDGDNLVDKLNNEANNRADAERRAADATAALEEERKKVARSADEISKKTGAAQKAQDDLQKQIKALQDENSAFKGGVGKEYKRLEETLATKEKASQEAVNEKDGKIETLVQDVVKLRKQIKELLQQKVERATPGVKAEEQVDGEISTVALDQNAVYINRGRANRLPLGLSFQVYDKATGVQLDGDKLGDGKAVITVVSLDENTAACRIVSVKRGMSIVPGDVIANIAYDANKTYRFYVLGDYDLDGVGKPLAADRRRVAGLIQQWGGAAEVHEGTPKEEDATRASRNDMENVLTAANAKLKDGTVAEVREMLAAALSRFERRDGDKSKATLSYDIDFLVVGAEPKLLDKPGTGADPVEVKKYNDRLIEFMTYKAYEEEARNLGIPILNQNRLLNLVGFYK